MTHYVLLKLAPGTDVDAAWKKVSGVYDALDAKLSFLHDPHVYRSCVERDSNADIMAVITLDSAEYLQTYLTDPLHVQMAKEMKESGQLIGRTSFDHM